MNIPKVLVVKPYASEARLSEAEYEETGCEVIGPLAQIGDLAGCIEKVRPDLVVIDQTASDRRDGWDTARKLRAASGVPVAVLTSDGRARLLWSCHDSVCFGFPVHMDRPGGLRQAVETCRLCERECRRNFPESLFREGSERLPDPIDFHDTISSNRTAAGSKSGRRKTGAEFPLEEAAQARESRQTNARLLREVERLNRALCAQVEERTRVEAALVSYQEKLRRLASELTLAEERERNRLAVNLHDDVSQTLAAAIIKLTELMETAESARTIQGIRKTVELVREASEATRRVTAECRPPELFVLGLGPALLELGYKTEVEHGIEVRVFFDEPEPPLPEEVRTLLYRCAREVMINAVKHAQAHRIVIEMHTEPDRVVIRIRDDGIGFDVESLDSGFYGPNSFGLFSVRERLDYLGGNVTILSAPGEGTIVTLAAPLRIPPE